MSVPETNGVLADRITLSVVTAREKVIGNPWIDARWRVIGVVAGVPPSAATEGRTLIYSDSDSTHYLWPGFRVCLYKHESESYYRNLLGETPSVYVVCQTGESGELIPVETTVDYVEAGARREAGDEVFPVRMPPEVYRWLEAFVVEHFMPEEPKMKRKRPDGSGGRSYEPKD